jgi:hypothetical protein
MSLLLGGLITLAVTAVVQILIIPWVQRRNRIRERWEKDVIELLTLLDEELGEPVSRVRYEILRLSDAQDPVQRGAADRRSDADDDVEARRADAIRAWEVLDKLTTRITNLTFRVIRVNHAAPDWRRLAGHTMGITTACARLNPGPWGSGSDSGRDARRAALSAINDHATGAARLLQGIGESMTPPRTYPMRRALAWTRARPARLWARIRRTPAIEAAED